MCWSCGCQATGGDPDDCHGDVRNLATVALQSAAAACGCDIPTVVANIAATLLTVGGGVAKGDRATSGALIKADDVKRVATYVAYPVNKADAGLAADGHRDFASKDEVERLAWNWMAKGARLGLWHLHGTDDYETVESGLHHGPDWVIKATDGSIQTVHRKWKLEAHKAVAMFPKLHPRQGPRKRVTR